LVYKGTRYASTKSPVVLWNIYLPTRLLSRLVIQTRFLSFPVLFSDSFSPVDADPQDYRRLGLRDIEPADDFTDLLIKTLPVNFPSLYLEGFDAAVKDSAVIFKNAPKVLMTTVGWYSDERFKFVAAHCSERGTIMCGAQHGGLYGTAKWMSPEKHEIELSDRYYTWGWTMANAPSVTPLPNPKLSNLLRSRNSSVSSKPYIFVLTSHPRYLYHFFSCPVGETFEEYVNSRNVFLGRLKEENRNRVTVRFYMSDYGRNEKERLRRQFPTLDFDDGKTGFLAKLGEIQLAIIDHPVTTMLESLAANIPTILFWEPRYWELRPEADPFFENLADAHIWHKSPGAAADFLNEISDNVDRWWGDPSTQRARQQFVNEFALTTEDWPKVWRHEMQRLVRSV